ncbi:cell division protein ZapA [Azotosporobacter soli]|uniref:cell division protein ZapA n=1 Tax=Azotosporobacter soli TaxID=3055040 RepID=UPI0031FED6DD
MQKDASVEKERKKNKITVEIFGELYALKSDGEIDQVMKVAALVDTQMKRVSRQNIRLSPVKVAVLAALNLAEEYAQLENDYKQLLKMVKEEGQS